MSEAEERAGQAFDKMAWLENMSASVKKGAAASKKKLVMLKPGLSLKQQDEEVQKPPPQEYMCPVTLQLMKDPVLLVQTGQVYDREGIEGWFMSGKNSDPVTGVKLKTKRLSPIFTLRSAIRDYANANGIELEVINEDEEGSDGRAEDSTDSVDVEPATILGLEGVSVYDAQTLCHLMYSGSNKERVAASGLLAEMSRYGDKRQMKRITKCIPIEVLKRNLESEIPGMPAQAARLLLHLYGDTLTLPQILNFLNFSNLLLQEDILRLLWQMAYRRRGKMLDVAKAVEDAGVQGVVAVLKPLADTTRNEDIEEEVRSYSAFVLCCMAMRPSLRAALVHEEAAPLLIHFLSTTTDTGFRFCLLKAIQYLSEDPRGRTQVRSAGGTRIFVLHLPPRNQRILYTNRVFTDFFAWVSVAETAVKGLYHLSTDDRARQEMKTTGTIAALGEMNRESKFPEAARSKYLCPLIGRVTASQAR